MSPSVTGSSASTSTEEEYGPVSLRHLNAAPLVNSTVKTASRAGAAPAPSWYVDRAPIGSKNGSGVGRAGSTDVGIGARSIVYVFPTLYPLVGPQVTLTPSTSGCSRLCIGISAVNVPPDHVVAAASCAFWGEATEGVSLIHLNSEQDVVHVPPISMRIRARSAPR